MRCNIWEDLIIEERFEIYKNSLINEKKIKKMNNKIDLKNLEKKDKL